MAVQTKPFGEIITAGVVRQALRDILVDHLEPVLAELAGRVGFDPAKVLPPKGYGAAPASPELAGEPLGVVVAPGVSGTPLKRADGRYEMPWDVAAAIVVPGRSRDEAQALAEVYGAAVRATVLQHPSLGGLAASTRWSDERYEEIAYNSGLSVWAATEVFSTVVTAAVDGYATAGPNPVVEQYINVFVSRSVLTGESQ